MECMEQVVYADVLLVVNFIINYLLLLFCGRLSGREIQRRRLMLAALLGAAGAFIIFLPPLGFYAMTAYKLLLAVLMVVAGYRWLSLAQLAKEVFLLFTVSFLLAGLCLALWLNTGVRGLLCYNGVTYFQVNLLTLAASVTIAYGALSLYSRLRSRGALGDGVWQAHLTLYDKSCDLTALVDTGNSLSEPFTGLPVAVVGVQSLLHLLPMELTAAVLSGGGALQDACAKDHGLRLIPCTTATGSEMLLALRPQELLLCRGEHRCRLEAVYLALSPQKIGGDCELLLPKEAVKLTV